MINYYYEIKDGIKVFGHNYKYLAHYDVKPNENFTHWRYFHDEAVKNSSRVWMENANGLTLIKPTANANFRSRADEKEIVWLKLICRDVETL